MCTDLRGQLGSKPLKIKKESQRYVSDVDKARQLKRQALKDARNHLQSNINITP